MFGQQGSLVKFSTPVLVSGVNKINKTQKQKKEEEKHHTQDILGQILPPKQHKTDNGQLWVQTVLSTPATKIQVIQLHQQLDKRLIQRQARQIGICPFRQQLFDQCFDEIIRQITIDCRQRGLLLVRVRDQYKNQIKAYKTLYQSSINHAMRRVIDSDQRKSKMVSCVLLRIYKQQSFKNNAYNYKKMYNSQLQQQKIQKSNKIQIYHQRHKIIRKKWIKQSKTIKNQKHKSKMLQKRPNDVYGLYFLIYKTIINNLQQQKRSMYSQTLNNWDFPRKKIYLSSLSQLIDKQTTNQPQTQINNQLFPQRKFAKKLSISHQRIKSSIQLRTQKYDVGHSSKKVKDMIIQNNYPKIFSKGGQKQETLTRSKSVQLPVFSSIVSEPMLQFNSNLYISQTRSQQIHQQSHSQNSSPQKNFLRKGSNLQKQIVINLLRNKLIKQKQLKQKKQYSNGEILKMIQVFKGVALNEAKQKRNMINVLKSTQKNYKQQNYKDINGWQHDFPIDNQDNQEK